MNNDANLKPCPFCGRVPAIEFNTESGGYEIYHDPTGEEDVCPIATEGDSLGEWYYDTEEEAAAAWNKRI